ncbi:DUF4133 domain-containing protein [Hymenobacter actinosclerus]|uniref:DUF4133 domain-containing protein n=1 Tax=Hymenobacter actinosclerus TaxID=82805 RepID=A0A1I0ILK1_9BACT|nr:DUF4133 domain-containing protein [Hymenobacter actinosclerus]SET97223.1 protein of unknown function [Hymenobacter actinosclerus]
MPIYGLNRGINKPVEFKGLVGSNIYLLVAGIGLVFALFVTFYLTGVPLELTVLLTFVAGSGMWAGVFALNRRFGEHGLMKAAARRSSPTYIINRHSRLFQRLNQDPTGRA